MASLRNIVLAGFVVLAGGYGTAQADVYTITVYTADVGIAFDALPGSTAILTGASNVQTATFTYTGTLNFSNTAQQNSDKSGDLNSNFFNSAGISNYVSASTGGADYGSFVTGSPGNEDSNFLKASGSKAGYGYGSLYVITDMTALAQGTNLTITHDDGVSVYVNGGRIDTTTAGPTTAITETLVNLPAGSPGYTLYYGRENGTPSVLTVAVPEPMSIALLGAGLFGIGMVRRRRV